MVAPLADVVVVLEVVLAAVVDGAEVCDDVDAAVVVALRLDTLVVEGLDPAVEAEVDSVKPVNEDVSACVERFEVGDDELVAGAPVGLNR